MTHHYKTYKELAPYNGLKRKFFTTKPQKGKILSLP